MQKLILAALYLFLFAAASFAQPDEYLNKHAEALAKNPEGLRVDLKLADKKTQFHQGEMIRLDADFFSTNTVYKFTNRTYDRSGRLWIDGFRIDRAGDIKDPLHDYFEKSFTGYVGGGLFNQPDLGAAGITVNYVLNEMYAIDKPGKYRLYISSTRVRKKDAIRFNDYENAVSNIVEFEILPIDIEWQKQKLAEALKIIGPLTGKNSGGLGCQTLRYLRSEDAALAMVERYKGDNSVIIIGACQHDILLGLYSSPYRELIVGKMEEKLRDPNAAINSDYFSALATLSFLLHHGDEFPVWDAATDFKDYQKKKEALRLIRDKEFEKCAAILEAALKDKKPDIYSASVNSVFTFRKPGTEMDDRLISAFESLSGEEQKALLNYRWQNIRTQKLLPGFRKLLERLDGPGQGNFNIELRDLVLKRLYDLAPVEGRERLLAEIRRVENRIDDKTLLALNDKELPEIEELLLKRAAGTNPQDVRRAMLLLERYGTAGAVRPLYAAYFPRIGSLECDQQKSFINYFLKHEPETGAKIVDAALSSRTKSACFKTMFNDFDEKYWSKPVESVLIPYLDDPDTGVVKVVVEALRLFGSVDAKPHIWKRFEKFKASPEKDIAARIETYGDRGQPQPTIEQTFAWALEGAVNWKLSPEEVSKLAELCVTDDCRKFVEANKEGLVRFY